MTRDIDSDDYRIRKKNRGHKKAAIARLRQNPMDGAATRQYPHLIARRAAALVAAHDNKINSKSNKKKGTVPHTMPPVPFSAHVPTYSLLTIPSRCA